MPGVASPEQLTRRVDRQAENLQAIADTVLDIKETVDQHTEELAAIRATLADHGGRLDQMDQRLDRIEDNQQRQGDQLTEVLTLLRGQSPDGGR